MIDLLGTDEEDVKRGLAIVQKINEKCKEGDEGAVALMGPTYALVETHANGSYAVGTDRETDKALAEVAEIREEIRDLKKVKGDISPDLAEKEKQYREELRSAIKRANKLLKEKEEKVPSKLSGLVDDVLED